MAAETGSPNTDLIQIIINSQKKRETNEETEIMNSRIKMNRWQLLGRREAKPTSTRPDIFRLRRPKHDPMLVLNMSFFNFADGWNRTFNPVKAHEQVR